MRVLGISAFHRDSAAALCIDGVLVAAAQEERFTRKPLDNGLPRRAARFCLDRAAIAAADLDALVFHEKPLRKFERTLATQLQAFPRSARTFSRDLFHWLGDRLWIRTRLAEEFGVAPEKVRFVEHARAHAALAFYSSPHDEAAVLVVDDLGEWATTTLARGSGATLTSLEELHFPHSLGLWLSAYTQFLGFAPGLDEERVEALAHLGSPRYEREVTSTAPEGDGAAFTIDPRCFRFAFDGEQLFEREFEARFAASYGPRRAAGHRLRIDAELDARDADLSASVQRVLESRVLGLARALRERTGCDVACLAGEVFRNRSLVARLASDGPFRELFVGPALGEAGVAAGAALEESLSLGAPRCAQDPTLALGAAASSDAGAGDGSESGPEDLAERLCAGQTVAWVRGALELGPESVASRLVLGAAGGFEARERLLGALQRSESYLPIRLLVAAELAAEWIELPASARQAAHVGGSMARARDELRRHAPSAVLASGAVWAQLVDRGRDAELHEVLLRMNRALGAPLLLAASFHLRSQPIVRTQADAVDAFRRSSLDALVVDGRCFAAAALI